MTKNERKILKTALEFIRDLVVEPFRMETEDGREKTIFEAKEIIVAIEKVLA